MQQICLEARAKINLTLDVLGQRTDGYHLLRSVMQSIDLADSLKLEKVPANIRLEVQKSNDEDAPIPTDRQNLVWRAAELFFHEQNLSAGVNIVLKKRIPVAAGLAGGSVDAAAVLFGLNKLYATSLSLTDLTRIGLKLGADIPYCLRGGTMLAEGIGEQLTPLPPLPHWSLVVVKTNASVSTATVYEHLDPSNFGDIHTTRFVEHLLRQDWQAVANSVGNSLETVTKRMVPEVELWKNRLTNEGAVAAWMSGSGPAVVGIFSRHDMAKEFLKRWSQRAFITLAKPCESSIKIV